VVKQEDGRRSRYPIQAHLPLPETTSRQLAVGEVPALLAGTSARLPVTRTRPAWGHRSRAACTHPGRGPAPGQPGPPHPARGPARLESLVLCAPPKSYDNWPAALAAGPAAGYQGQTGPRLATIRRGCHRISSAFMYHPRSPDATHAAAADRWCVRPSPRAVRRARGSSRAEQRVVPRTITGSRRRTGARC
jgi:hypothetical protein